MTKELTSQETLAKLNETRWLAFWQRIGAIGQPKPVYRDLVRRYQEPPRFYHTLEHISQCLDELKSVYLLSENPEAIEMALWYHDVVYDPHAQDNEEKSAAIALHVAKEARLPAALGEKVANLILVTKHNQTPLNFDAALVMDIDLSGFGKPWEEFERNTRLIRQEYQWVSDRDFAVGRMAILKVFLERPSVYLTVFFREKYEAQARQNLQR